MMRVLFVAIGNVFLELSAQSGTIQLFVEIFSTQCTTGILSFIRQWKIFVIVVTVKHEDIQVPTLFVYMDSIHKTI